VGCGCTRIILVACYATLMAVSLLPFIGLTLAVDESMWADAIILFTGMTVVAVAAGIRKHRSFMSLVLAMVGACLIGYCCSDSIIVSSSSSASH
jgi:arsenite methyltransferase